MRKPGRHEQADVWDELMAGAHHVAALDHLGDSCFLCVLRDAYDRLLTTHWLRTLRPSQRDMLGATCCPLHVWRLHEVLCGIAPWMASPVGTDGKSDVSAHHHHHHTQRNSRVPVAQALLDAIETFLADLQVAGARFRRTGMAGRVIRWRGDIPPGLLWERPPCPLCLFGEPDDDRLVALFAAACPQWAGDTRRRIARSLCPRHRRISYPVVRVFPEFPEPILHQAIGGLSGWWSAPEVGVSDLSFVQLLLSPHDHVPTERCPACWVRRHHEHLLITDLRQMEPPTSGAFAAERNNVLRLAALHDDLCARHSALAHETRHQSNQHPAPAGEDADVDGAGDDSGYLPRIGATTGWPTGTLRCASEDFTCPVCAAVKGWDLVRMEGLRRAASGVFLSDDIIGMLQLALAQRPHWFCLPHWRRATATGPRQATLTLLDVQRAAIQSLHGALAEQTRRLTEQQPPVGANETAADVYFRAAQTLGGYPA